MAETLPKTRKSIRREKERNYAANPPPPFQ